ncbi:MAG: CocE/NonD family hydrolase [Bacteroidetes bacterium]|nr:CocE/NonD family hydrolase [Bacteroidota bacterium]MBS1930204.1 CocE/NonD family hydrolase [Bacteroidota bacterium]
MKKSIYFFLFVPVLLFQSVWVSCQPDKENKYVKENYTKREVMIPMRDGVKLFTAVYEPKDNSHSYPILMERTPYSCSPYGEDKFPGRLGPNEDLMKEKYIFVYQDVRGRFKSEGDFQEMTPAIDNKKSNKDVDESSDTYDAIEWLLKNTHNNGNVGLYGISYPGFYATASLPNAHPAIKAVSPQAPVTDEFIGDDCNHNGAFYLLDNFGFYNYFDGEKNQTGDDYKSLFHTNYKDAYQFFLEMGTLKNANGPAYFNGKGIWGQTLQHDTYDHFWQSRNIRPHLKNIKPAVLVVGGWFDAEDMFGAMRTYEAIEKQSPKNNNRIILGPWTHGAWARNEWTKFGSYKFGSNLNNYYRNIETGFFNYYLKGKGDFKQPEATVFETGTNQWKEYPEWPPSNIPSTAFYFQDKGKLSNEKPKGKISFNEYVSDPNKPVPYTNGVYGRRNNEYLVEDQRFAEKYPEVVTFTSDVLNHDVNITGRLRANLFVSTTGSDADFIVKLIDVLPDDEPNPDPNPRNFQMGGFERMVRAEVFRGKFRNSYEKPQPFIPGKIEKVSFDLNEVAHVFKKGHRIMVQVQSSWFPIVDRNPQKFMKIPEAHDSDFQKATIRIYHDVGHPSNIMLPIIK